VNLEIEEGEFVTVMGPSGCGKSTLLHLIGGIDRPTSGHVTVNGQDLGKASEEDLTRFRREHVGFVFQFYNLLPTLSAVENVELPLIALGFPRKGRRRMARAVLEVVELGDRLHHKPGELSGGEQQRVAIARAMVANPKIILADEPTGDLDSKSAAMVVGLMRELNENLDLTFLVVTHDPEVGSQGSRTVYLKDGQIVGDERRRPKVSGAE
ncbi:MAG: ABC transporter ATP-binding protein, partial [Anaerolineae bacterium]